MLSICRTLLEIYVVVTDVTTNRSQSIQASSFFLILLLWAGLPLPTQAQTGDNVEFVGHIGGETNAVFVQGNYAYIGEGPLLTILDISTPAAPTVVGKSGLFPGVVEDIHVDGGYAYVVAGSGGLRVVDVSTPANPTEVGFYDTPDDARGVAVSGSYAYVVAGSGGLRVVDVSTPANPTEVGFYDTPDDARGVAVSGSYAYVADNDRGLRVVDVSTPANPTEVGYLTTRRVMPGASRSAAALSTWPMTPEVCGWWM
jgi:hypothetical protein